MLYRLTSMHYIGKSHLSRIVNRMLDSVLNWCSLNKMESMKCKFMMHQGNYMVDMLYKLDSSSLCKLSSLYDKQHKLHH